MTDELLDAFIYKFFGVDPPSVTRQIIAKATSSATFNNAFVKLGASSSFRVYDAIGPLRDLLRGLIAERPDVVIPELGIYCENDSDLANLTSIDGRFYTGIVYAAHPGDPKYFVRLADFHRFLEEEKRAEFIRLAAALGAKSLLMLDADTHSHQGSIEARVEHAPVGGAVGAVASTKQA